jgi:hypothetical protein
LDEFLKRLRGERLFPTFPRDFRIGERGRPVRDAMPEDAGGARIPAERRRARPAILRAAAVRAHWSFGIRIFDIADRPPIFLAKLQSDLAARGVQSVQKEFARAANVLALNENIIINCTGLGAGTIWQDRLVYPVKGQLVHLPPQPNLQYLYSGFGYLFPRQDAVIIGGTDEANVSDDQPNLQMCKAVLAKVKGVFDGTGHPRMLAAAAIPAWFLHNK